MTEISDLRVLLSVSQAQYDHQRQSFAALIAEEQRLYEELNRLAALDNQARGDANQTLQMRAVGADLLWQGWLGRSRTTLNMQLAQVRAKKEFEQAKVHKAFGKVAALQEVIKDAESTVKRQETAAALEKAINLSLG